MGVVARSNENLKKCICMKCPSYTFTCKMLNMPGNIMAMMGDVSKKIELEAMFCAFEKSSCIKEEKGCICGTCAVHKENKLEKGFYCIATGGK